jgi:hypothetical protein
MKTITPPQGEAVVVEEVPSWQMPEDFTAFTVRCSDSDCRAKLLVESPGDLTYYTHTWYDGSTDYRLVVLCPHCSELIAIESYQGPGNPSGRLAEDSFRYETTKYTKRVPDSARSKAYRSWEDAMSEEEWELFFNTRSMRTWESQHPRQARKMRTRLLPRA